MKVKISNYPNRLVCRIHTRYMDKTYGIVDWPTEYTRFEKLLEKLEDVIQSVYNLVNVPFLDKREQKVKVRIDRWDTWSMDYTLAPIILPMLVQLKAEKHGAPFVDLKDVPKELHGKKLTKKQKENGEVDDKHFERWDWVLDEMIYAFDCKANKDDVYMRFDIDDREDMKAEQERISNGFRLFGKYYESLWD
jgi:hypothetical protein